MALGDRRGARKAAEHLRIFTVMNLPSAVPNLALILPLPSTSSVNLGQESHEGTGHCGSPRPHPPHALGLEADG